MAKLMVILKRHRLALYILLILFFLLSYIPIYGLSPVARNLLQPMFAGIGASTPLWVGPLGGVLILDLDGDGHIALTDVAGGAYFDMRSDRYAERTAWVGAGDGMLVHDADNDGVIEGYQELLTSPNSLKYVIYSSVNRGSEKHFAPVSTFDTNKDRKITSSDLDYKRLKIWQDINQDAKSDAGELKTLENWKIESIDLSGTIRDPFLGTPEDAAIRSINQNTITYVSSFILTNGEKREIVEAWLSHDMMNTRYTGSNTLNPKVLFLPTLKGFGELPDLHIEMSQNAALLASMEKFVTKRTFTQLFSDFEAVKSEVRDMMFLWVNVAKTPQPSINQAGFSGVYSLIPEYSFLKKFMGVESTHLGMWLDEGPFAPPTPKGVRAVTDSFENLLTQFTSQLIFQVGANKLFETGSGYDPWTSTFSGNFAITQSAVKQLQTVAASQTDKAGFWNNFVRFLNATKELSDVTATEKTWIDTAIRQSTSDALNWTKVVATLNEQQITTSVYKATMNGTQWDDSMTAFLNPNETNQVNLHGGYGDDKLYGGYGNDWLQGGVGNDYMAGGNGNDTYFYEYGHDVIEDVFGDESNTIQFASGIKLSDISLKTFTSYDSGSHTYLDVRERGTITIAFLPNTHPAEIVKLLKFSDGTTKNLSDLPVKILGADWNDTMSSSGWTGQVEFYGLRGDDVIDADYSPPYAMMFVGGMGHDKIRGGAGDSTYFYDSGNDVYFEAPGGGNDKIVFANTIKPSMVTVERVVLPSGDSADMLIKIAGLGSIVIQSQYTDGGGIETLHFSNGTFMQLAPSSLASVQR